MILFDKILRKKKSVFDQYIYKGVSIQLVHNGLSISLTKTIDEHFSSWSAAVGSCICCAVFDGTNFSDVCSNDSTDKDTTVNFFANTYMKYLMQLFFVLKETTYSRTSVLFT